jgi:hypothetical protein
VNLLILILAISVLTTQGETKVSDDRTLTAPGEAVRVVNENLNDAVIPFVSKDPSYFEKRHIKIGESDYSLMRLGEPIAGYLIYAKDICNLADSLESEIPAGGELVEYYFPVFCGEDYVLGVSANLVDGKWRSSGFSEPNMVLMSWLMRVRMQYPSEHGYRVSMLRGEWLNMCLRLHLNDQVTKIAVPVPAQMIGSQEVGAHIGPWIPIDDAVENLRAHAQRYKKNWCDKSEPDG